jgi:hypothetical protein
MLSDMPLDGALIDVEPCSQLVDGYAVDIALDQLLHLGWPQSPADPLCVNLQ